MYKNIVKSIVIIASFASPFMLTAGEAEREAASELLEVSHFEKVMDDSLNATVEMMKQIDPNMSSHEATIRKFYRKYMSAESLRNEMIDLYAEIFTEGELREITAFYKTETGQKSLEKLPELMQRAMQIGQTRVMQNMGELQRMLSEEELAKQ
ncbi:hypothetical protein PHSC3_000917 [Chlamydiales bacterium STE3]|nr:hypothetical protein PHSC3_000917 [Chlamydiales bacterium STE3]